MHLNQMEDLNTLKKLIAWLVALSFVSAGYAYINVKDSQAKFDMLTSTVMIEDYCPKAVLATCLGSMAEDEPKDQDKRFAHGSGVVIFHQGSILYVLTAAHVVDNDLMWPGWKVRIIGHSGQPFDATIIKKDIPLDLALLKVENVPTGFTAPPESVCIQDIDYYDKVYSLGYPLNLEETVTDGIVSNPLIYMPFEDNHNTAKFIQHTAFIAPGNSGGPLFANDGLGYCVVGINVRANEKYGYISLAVSTQDIRDFLKGAF